MPKKKKFINKKNAVTFHLVHRSQKDPLQADEDAPKRVLLHTGKEDLNSNKEEQIKFGIYYEDDYNYMQHLKEANEISKVEQDTIEKILIPSNQATDKPDTRVSFNLPSKLFASNIETDIGLLNKAAPIYGPCIDMDPDLVAAMDDDFDFADENNTLEDDFVIKANTDKIENNNINEFVSDIDTNEFFDVQSFNAETFKTVKSRFTEYSMSSSVIKRNDYLSAIDDRFENFFIGYDDEEMGALDQEEIAGNIGEENLVMKAALEEFNQAEMLKQRKLKDEIQKTEIFQCDDNTLSDSNKSEDIDLIKSEIKDDKWDCETILSTYTTIYNHPKIIDETNNNRKIQLTKRLGLPSNVLPSEPRSITHKENLKKQKSIMKKTKQLCFVRERNEGPEERILRKKCIKEDKRKRREEKKMTSSIFKNEKLKQQNMLVKMQQNLSAIKII